MTDYLTRLVARTLGVAPTVRPEAPPTFASGTGDPPYPSPKTGPARHHPPGESTLLAQPDARPELGERGDGPPSTTRDAAQGDETRVDEEGRRSSPGSEESRPGLDPPEATAWAGNGRAAGSSGTEQPHVVRAMSAPGNSPGTRGTEEAGERVATEHRLPETGLIDYSPGRANPAPPSAAVSEQAGQEPEHVRAERATESTASGVHPTERTGVRRGELPNARARAGSPAGSRSDLWTKFPGEQPAASQTLRQEERSPRPEPIAFENRERSPAAPERVERVAEGRAPTTGAPLVSNDAERVTPSAAVPHRRAATEGTPSPTIRITIGRVEVRAVAPEPAQPPPEARPEPGLSLDDYLRQHTGGRR